MLGHKRSPCDTKRGSIPNQRCRLVEISVKNKCNISWRENMRSVMMSPNHHLPRLSIILSAGYLDENPKFTTKCSPDVSPVDEVNWSAQIWSQLITPSGPKLDLFNKSSLPNWNFWWRTYKIFLDFKYWSPQITSTHPWGMYKIVSSRSLTLRRLHCNTRSLPSR